MASEKKAEQTSESPQGVQNDVNPQKCFIQQLALHLFYIFLHSKCYFCPKANSTGIPIASTTVGLLELKMMRSLCRKMGWSRTGWAFLGKDSSSMP